MAQELGFGGIAENSLDAVSNRDFVLDYLSAAATCAGHLSQLGGEIVLWSTTEFGFCRVSDAFASGSSLMPQKKNPDAAELLRAKAPRVVGRLAGLHGVLHGLPLTYNKDLQEDKEPLFDAIDTLELSLRVARAMLAEIEFDRERMAAAASDELIAATDVADLLVRQGVPFREAHGIVGGLVRAARRARQALSELTDEELAELAPQLDPPAFRALLEQSSWLESKVSEGGTSLARVRDQLAQARHVLEEAPGLRLERDFYARSVHDVARDLIGCVVRHGETAGRIVETESYHMDEPACHAYVGVTPRTADAVRPARARLRLLLLRRPLAAERGVRGRGRRGGRADPRARAGRRARRDARAARRRARASTSAPGPASSPRRWASGSSLNGSSLVDGPIEVLAREPDARAAADRGRRAGRDHQGRRAARGASATPTAAHVSRPWPAADARAAA